MKNKLYCDMKTINEKIEFFESGRAHETGIIAQSLVPDIVKLLKKSKIITHVYNSGYELGHHNTVESCFSPVHYSDMDTYQEDVVEELVEELIQQI